MADAAVLQDLQSKLRRVGREALTLGSDIFLDKTIGIAEIALAIQDRLNKVEKR